MVTFEEFEDMTEEIVQTMPEVFFRELNGGVFARESVMIHPESRGEELLIMGQYCVQPHLGRFIVLYYGSFMRVYGNLPKDILWERIRKVILHEFRHHLESLAGERDLEIEDAVAIARYKAQREETPQLEETMGTPERGKQSQPEKAAGVPEREEQPQLGAAAGTETTVPGVLETPERKETQKMKFEFREACPEDGDTVAEIERICFPPNEACSEIHMKERLAAAPELFLLAIQPGTGKIAGFLNGIATEEERFRDEFFTDAGLHHADGKNVMLLGLDVLPEFRRQGLATELVTRYAERETARGRSMLVLTCLEEKVAMYRKMGFQDLGLSESVWGGEAWHEMSLLLHSR